MLSGPQFEVVATSFIPDLDVSDPNQVGGTIDVLKSVLFRFEDRLPGIHDDIFQRDTPEIDAWPFEAMQVSFAAE